MVMDQWKGEGYCLVLSTGLLVVLMVMDQWKGEGYCLVLSTGLLVVLMVMDHRTNEKEFYGLLLSSGLLAA